MVSIIVKDNQIAYDVQFIKIELLLNSYIKFN